MKNLIIILLVILYPASVWLDHTQVHELEIFFLDIGQGDSILVKTPDDHYLLVDGGLGVDVLARLGDVLPFWQRELDVIIATHPDADHIGGLEYLFGRYEIGQIYYNNFEGGSLLSQEFYRKGQEYSTIAGIDELSDFRLGCCVEVDILWPLVNQDLEQLETNDTSVAFVLSYLQFDIFMAGDLPSKYEEMLALPEQAIEVLKVGHHGNKTSTSVEFLADLKPKLAVISCGRDNKFGHPHAEVLKNLQNLAVMTIRTDQLGTIKLYSDGQSYGYDARMLN